MGNPLHGSALHGQHFAPRRLALDEVLADVSHLDVK